jgi:V8-like Glu-specific endopeptidase
VHITFLAASSRVRRATALTAAVVWTASISAISPTASAATAFVHSHAPTTAAHHFDGWAAVGAIFNGSVPGAAHHCTGAVVHSRGGDVVVTAAHCVYRTNPSNLYFVPRFHAGKSPEGVWHVVRTVLPSGWAQSHDPNQDYAFLIVASHGTQTLEHAAGALTLAKSGPLPRTVSVIGYNDVKVDREGDVPIICRTRAYQISAHQERFDCGQFRSGTSGGPWIADGTDHIIGVIGGYQQGGRSPSTSYSTIFGQGTIDLYRSVAG